MKISKQSWTAWGFASITLLIYAVACIAPAVDLGPKMDPFDSHRGMHRGCSALVFGWLDLMKTVRGGAWERRVSGLAWLANALGFAGLVLLVFRLSTAATVVSLVTLALGVWYLIYPNGIPLIGAYIWVASMGVLMTGSVTVMMMRVLSKNTTRYDAK